MAWKMTQFSISSTSSCSKWTWRVQISSRLGWSSETLPYLWATKRVLRNLSHTLTTVWSINLENRSMRISLILWCTLNSRLLSRGWRSPMIFWYWFLTWISSTSLTEWGVSRLKLLKRTGFLDGAMSILIHLTRGLTRRVIMATTGRGYLSWSLTRSTKCSSPQDLTKKRTRRILTWRKRSKLESPKSIPRSIFRRTKNLEKGQPFTVTRSRLASVSLKIFPSWLSRLWTPSLLGELWSGSKCWAHCPRQWAFSWDFTTSECKISSQTKMILKLTALTKLSSWVSSHVEISSLLCHVSQFCFGFSGISFLRIHLVRAFNGLQRTFRRKSMVLSGWMKQVSSEISWNYS